MKKLKIGCLIVVGVLIVAVLLGIISILFFGHVLNPDSPPLQTATRAARIEEYFLRDKELLAVVKDYLIVLRLEYERGSITIRGHEVRGQFDGTIYLGSEHGWISIEDEVVLGAIKGLFREGYQIISINEKYIRFLQWRTLDNGWGILYVLDRSEPYVESLGDEGLEITLLGPLPIEGWYYYMSS